MPWHVAHGVVRTVAGLAVLSHVAACGSPKHPRQSIRSSESVHGTDLGFETAQPQTVGIDPVALDAVLEGARQQHSDAVVIVKNGKLVIDESFGADATPMFAMSASKAITALAVMHLVEHEGLDLDAELGSLFPELVGTDKAAITVRQLLSHTSGLPRSRGGSAAIVSILDQVTAARLDFSPGTAFGYSNIAVDFLAVVVHRAAGTFLDAYLQEHIFDPLGISTATWMKDRSGHPMAAGELSIRPIDLAKVGQMMADGGAWAGARVLTGDTITAVTAAAQSYDPSSGLLWWRKLPVQILLTAEIVETWKSAGLSGEALAAMTTMVGRAFPSEQRFRETLWDETAHSVLIELRAFFAQNMDLPFPNARADGPVESFSARGWLGQRLVVVPSCQIVGVRMRAPTAQDYRDAPNNNYTHPAFEDDMVALCD